METKYEGTNFIKYGIFEEVSHIRAHVSNRLIYVFKTKNLIQILHLKDYPIAKAFQPNYDEPTAIGFLVPITDIYDVRILKFTSWQGWNIYDDKWNTSQKGKWAVDCVIELLKLGRFPLWLDAKQNNNTKLDIEGTDILIIMDQRIQVKCDYPAFKTGNLYIQTHEINPNKMF